MRLVKSNLLYYYVEIKLILLWCCSPRQIKFTIMFHSNYFYLTFKFNIYTAPPVPLPDLYMYQIKHSMYDTIYQNYRTTDSLLCA